MCVHLATNKGELKDGLLGKGRLDVTSGCMLGDLIFNLPVDNKEYYSEGLQHNPNTP